MNRAMKLAASVPWAISPEWLQQILAIANREGPGPEAVSAELGRPLDNTRSVSVFDRVAVIPVTGPIMRRASLFTAVSGMVSVDLLARDLRTTLASDEVDAILLDVDSPGGEVNGIHELAEMLLEARAQKPIGVYAGGTCASAAYWLAAAAGDITVDATAIVGSIGVVMALPNPAAEKAEQIEIVSSNAPNKRPDVSTEDGRATVLATVDALAAVFTSDVARYRGVGPDVVAKKYGAGGVFVGADAVRAGLVDRLGSFEDALAALGARAAAIDSTSTMPRTSPMSLHRHAPPAPKASATVPRAAADAPPAQEPPKDDPPADKPAEQAADPQKCGGCAALNAAGSKFCSTCGAAFPEKEEPGDEPPPSSSDEGEDMAARSLASITGQQALSAQLGVVHAWKHAATEELPRLQAKVGELHAKIAQLEAAGQATKARSDVDALVADARAAQKIPRGAYGDELERKVRALAAKDVEMARACVDALPAHPAMGAPTKEPAKPTGEAAHALVHNGKRFEQMSFKEQAELQASDAEQYDRMLADATNRGALR